MKKRVGRPSQAESFETQERILAAAAKLFEAHTFKAVSIRQIAEEANVNVAMVSYYFVDKMGLFEHLLDQVFSKIRLIAEEIGRDKSKGIMDFIRSYSYLLSENPWFPIFLAKEVYFGESPIKSKMLERFRVEVNPFLIKSIQEEIECGRFRDGLDVQLIMVSLGGLVHHPYTIKASSGLSYDKDAVDRLIQHNCEMFLFGVARR